MKVYNCSLLVCASEIVLGGIDLIATLDGRDRSFAEWHPLVVEGGGTGGLLCWHRQPGGGKGLGGIGGGGSVDGGGGNSCIGRRIKGEECCRAGVAGIEVGTGFR